MNARSRILAPLIAMLIAATATAQSPLAAPPGELAMTVRLPDQSPLPGATVRLLAKDGFTIVKQTVSSARGQVRFARIKAGDYFLEFMLSGFFTMRLGPIPIRYDGKGPDIPRQLDIFMVPGPIEYLASGRTGS